MVHDPAEVRLSAVKDAIVKAGFNPLEAQSEQVDEHQERRLAETVARKRFRYVTAPLHLHGVCWACQSQASFRRS